jgi:hypothetical protein
MHLWVVQKAREWSNRLDCSVAASGVDDESEFRVAEAWDASPGDGISAVASSRAWVRVSTVTLSKAFRRLGFIWPVVRGGICLPAMADVDGERRRRPA